MSRYSDDPLHRNDHPQATRSKDFFKRVFVSPFVFLFLLTAVILDVITCFSQPVFQIGDFNLAECVFFLLRSVFDVDLVSVP